eukprot:5072546-Amphidinium_carterae.1
MPQQNIRSPFHRTEPAHCLLASHQEVSSLRGNVAACVPMHNFLRHCASAVDEGNHVSQCVLTKAMQPSLTVHLQDIQS